MTRAEIEARNHAWRILQQAHVAFKHARDDHDKAMILEGVIRATDEAKVKT